MPVRSFDAACALVIEHMSRVAPLGLWAVTRVVDGRQLVLASSGDAYPVEDGDEFAFCETPCSAMVSGAAPRTAPDVARVPEYAAVACFAPMPLGAYVGTPIVAPDGELFGTVCGSTRAPSRSR